MQGTVNKIEGIFECSLYETGHVTIAIYNDSGQMVKLVFNDISHARGAYRIYFTFRTGNLPQEEYYARMTRNGKKEKEMKIEF